MTMWIKRHQIYSFFILAFAISWAIWIPVILFVSKDGEFHPLLYIGGYGPFLSAVLVTWIAEGGHGLRQCMHAPVTLEGTTTLTTSGLVGRFSTFG